MKITGKDDFQESYGYKEEIKGWEEKISQRELTSKETGDFIAMLIKMFPKESSRIRKRGYSAAIEWIPDPFCSKCDELEFFVCRMAHFNITYCARCGIVAGNIYGKGKISLSARIKSSNQSQQKKQWMSRQTKKPAC